MFYVFFILVFLVVAKIATYKYDAFLFDKLRLTLFSICNIRYFPVFESRGVLFVHSNPRLAEKTADTETNIEWHCANRLSTMCICACFKMFLLMTKNVFFFFFICKLMSLTSTA